MKIRAAVLRQMEVPRPYTESHPLRIEELTLDPPGEGEVLVRIAAAGLCHSDLSVIDGNRPRPLPMALGHEGAGVIAATGAGVRDFAVGDHVVLVFVPSCGRCRPCLEGRPALCEPAAAANAAGELIGGGRRLHDGNGDPVNHHLGVSCFADHAVVSQNSLVKIDRRLPLDLAAVFGCAVLTGTGAVLNTAGVRPGEDVAVIGLGGVGLAAVLGAVLAGARRIIAVDLLAEKRDLARSLGATAVIDPMQDDAVRALRELTDGGVHHAIETAGSVRALEFAYAVTRRGGQTVTAGLAHPDHTLPLQQVSLVAEERTLKGSYIGSCVPGRDLPDYLALYKAGRLAVDRLISHRLRLEEINEGFERLASGAAIRQVVVFGD